MFCGLKCPSVTVVGEPVRVKATLDKGPGLSAGAQGSLMVSALGRCTCAGPWVGEREAAGVAGRGACVSGRGGGGGGSGCEGLTLSVVCLLLVLQVHS